MDLVFVLGDLHTTRQEAPGGELRLYLLRGDVKVIGGAFHV